MRWQEKQKILEKVLIVGRTYKVSGKTGVIITGVYRGHENGRYLFENNDGLFKANLHKVNFDYLIIEEA
jgi:hypothetical protein